MSDFFAKIYPSLLDLLEKRRKLFEDYKEHSLSLQKLISADDGEAATAKLADRAKLIEAVNALQKELKAPLKAYNDIKSGSAAADDRIKTADAVITDTRGIILEIQEIDAKNAKDIENLMRQTGDESKKLSATRKGIGQYAQKDLIFLPGFFDELK